MNHVSIIILNWNGKEHLKVCLDSVLRQNYNNYEVMLVDNGSTDDSVNFVKTNYPPVKIIECRKNYGFAEGNNIGIREAMKDLKVKYIVTLNNDTEVKEDWLEQLLKVMEGDPRIGACTSKMLYFDNRKIVDTAGDFYYSGSLKVHPRGHGKPDRYFQQEECLIACAGAALYRREALEQVKLGNDYFDSDFFTYIEDTDLSLRMRLAGWKCVFVPSAVVYHKVSATTSKLKDYKKKYYSARNRIFFMIKIYPLKLWSKALRNPVTYQKKSYGLNFFTLYLKLLVTTVVHFPKMLAKRKLIKQKFNYNKKIFSEWQKKFTVSE